MAHPTRSAVLAATLAGISTLATAANPLGAAVAGAPSLFVLAVAEARGDTRENKAEIQEREPRQEAQANASDRSRPASVQASPQRSMHDTERADERKLSLR